MSLMFDMEIFSSIENEDSLSNFSEYQKCMDNMVNGEDDEWLYSISKPSVSTKKSLIFSWLSSQASSSDEAADLDYDEFEFSGCPNDIDACSIGSVYDLEAMTDMKLFGVTAEEAKNYGSVDLGLYDGFTIEELLEPLGFESDYLKIPTEVQTYLDDCTKKIEHSERNGLTPLASFFSHNERYLSSFPHDASKHNELQNPLIPVNPMHSKKNSDLGPKFKVSPKEPLRRNRSLIAKSSTYLSETPSQIPQLPIQRSKSMLRSSGSCTVIPQIQRTNSTLKSASYDSKGSTKIESSFASCDLNLSENARKTALADKLYPSRIPRPPVQRTWVSPASKGIVRQRSQLSVSSASEFDLLGPNTSGLPSQGLSEVRLNKSLRFNPAPSQKGAEFISRIPIISSQRSVEKLSNQLKRYSGFY